MAGKLERVKSRQGAQDDDDDGESERRGRNTGRDTWEHALFIIPASLSPANGGSCTLTTTRLDAEPLACSSCSRCAHRSFNSPLLLLNNQQQQQQLRARGKADFPSVHTASLPNLPPLHFSSPTSLRQLTSASILLYLWLFQTAVPV
jgi:hypothetical protein